MDKLLILFAAISLSCFTSTSGLRCWECSEARDDADCRAKGKMRECMFNQDACEIELREHEGWGGHLYLYKHCKQSKACDNNHIQNPRAAWEPSQCNPADINSVCRCCCYEDECNVAQDACFSRRGCHSIPARISHGTVSCTSGFGEGSICTVTCNANTRLHGSATTMCRGDGTWSHELAHCLSQQCPPRTNLANGWYICSNGYYAGSHCTAHCRPGYTMIGAEVSTCMTSTLRWNYFPPQCKGLECPDRGTVVGGTVNCTNGNNLQSRCKVECEGARRLEGIIDSYCEDAGTWSHELPVCVDIQCGSRGTIVNGDVSCTLGVDVNSICTATCDPGFVLDGPGQSTCLPTGFWDNPLPRCIVLMCPPRGTFKLGTVACTEGSSIGSICTSTCQIGTLLVGSQTSVCQPDGTWDVPLPSCEVIQCPERTLLRGGTLRCKNRFVGDTCLAVCDWSRRTIGVSSSICLPTGEWSDPLPTCEDIICPDLDFSLEPGTMTCTNEFFYRSICSFRCNPGYRVFGAPFVGCRKNGRWTTRVPQCRLIVCPNRGRLPRGSVTCTDRNNVDSVCDATCNSGYTLRGRDPTTCLPNGRWSSKLPVCEPIECPIRGTIQHGSVSCTNDNFFGSVCTADCDGRRELTGARLSRCGEDGTWDVPLPSCRSLPCTDQGTLRHGTITCTDDWNVLSTCTFRCVEEGYQIYPQGRRQNVCRPSQRWSVPKPCCSRPCPPFAVMDFVLVLDSSSSIGVANWVLLTEFVKNIIRSFEVAPDLANFAIFRYNRNVDTTTQIFLNSHPGDVNGLITAFDAIPYDGSGTFTGNALNHALVESLSVLNGNRPDVKDVVMVITDGKAADDVKTPSDALRDAGVQILVLGIKPPRGSLDLDQLREIAGRERNLIVTDDRGFAGLDDAFVTRLGGFICGEPCE